MPAGGKPYPSLAELARNNPQAYRDMSVDERLTMVQQPYFNDRESMSPEDLSLLRLLSARQRQENPSNDTTPGFSGTPSSQQSPGMLSKLWQALGLGAVQKANPYGLVSDELQRVNEQGR